MEDWFSDMNLFRLIQTSEMLMPNINSIASSLLSTDLEINSSSSSSLNNLIDYPHLSMLFIIIFLF
jgi:hypothetical protein